MPSLSLAFRFALRELRGGLSGFWIFLACIMLGVAAIGAVGSVAGSVSSSIEDQGRSILGGDIGFETVQRPATDAELRRIGGLGNVSETVSLRSMARKPDGSDQSLVELKAVDNLYPLYGALKTAPETPLADLLRMRDDAFGAVAPQILFDRLGLQTGDVLLVGDLKIKLNAVLVTEPDALSEGFGFAPRLMISRAALEKAGLIREGSLAEYGYKVKLPQPAARSALLDLQETLRDEMREQGVRVRTAANAAPALSESVERFSQFLTLVALCALLVGGVGVANAVQAHLDGKRSEIATLKSLGGSASFVSSVYLIQIMLIGLMGSVLGMALATLVPPLLSGVLAGILPIAIDTSIQPGSLVLAGLFGLLTTLGFALIPIGRARGVKPTLLFRDAAVEGVGEAPVFWRLAAFAVLALTSGLAVLLSEQKRTALMFLGGAVLSFLVLGLVAMLVIWAARRMPRFRSTVLRMAVGNLHRPGSITRPVVISLGLGLTLLTTISLIDANLRSQISGRIAGQAPDFFYVDIQSSEIEPFKQKLAEVAPNGNLQTVPMLRGRITRLKGVDIADYKVPPEASWVTRGDRGLTYSPTLPSNSTLDVGEWWPADYTGEPLVSFAAEEAGELGLEVGDLVTVSVLGREITAKIANLRAVEWRSLSINFVMVFSPSAFKGAPHAWLATLSDPGSTPQAEAKVLNEVTKAFPAVTSVRVKDALEIANGFVGQFATAVRAAASVALVTSVLVLAGALAAGNRMRLRDAVILKMLGATRKTLVSAFVLEYALAGLATAVFALLAGTAAAWFVITNIMNLQFENQIGVALATVGISLAVTIVIGLVSTWSLLGKKAAPVLRTI